MNHWRYYLISGSELAGERCKHSAVFPVPHLLKMSFHPTRDKDPGAMDELQLVFSTETVTVRGKNLWDLARTLAELRADPKGGQVIPIPGGVNAEVEFGSP